jgi:hypothetical protein
MLGEGGELRPIVGKKKLLVPGIPQPRELTAPHDRRLDRHLVAASGDLAELDTASILLYANDAARTADRKSRCRESLKNSPGTEAFVYGPHGRVRVREPGADVKWGRERS